LETAWPKSIETKARSEAFISLKALASRKVLDEGVELNYATFFAKDSNNTFTGVDGTIYQVCLTGFGLRILRKQPDLQTQMNLPGLDG
jgi:3-phenylpropionate/cinnamic acid dioxygenase small subunit